MIDNFSKLDVADRIEIFKHLAVNDDNIDIDILKPLSETHLQEFNDFCDEVFANKDKVKDISITKQSDGSLSFNIEYNE